MGASPSDFVGPIKTVWDLINGLLKITSEKRKDIFNAHIEPLHEKVLEIHKDYLLGLTELRNNLVDEKIPPLSVIQFLKDRRRDLEFQRDLAGNLAEGLKNFKRIEISDEILSAIKEFCESIIGYLHATSNVGCYSWYTSFIEHIETQTELINDLKKASLRPGFVQSERWLLFTDEKRIWRTSDIGGGSGEQAREDLLDLVNQTIDKNLPDKLSWVNSCYSALKAEMG